MFLEKIRNSPEGSIFQGKAETTTSAQFKQYLRRDIVIVSKDYNIVNLNGGQEFYRKVQKMLISILKLNKAKLI